VTTAVFQQPRKRFGQNFLHDPAIITRLLTIIAPRPGQHVLEIGPGRGALTDGLLQAVGALTVIEIDRDLVAWLTSRYPEGSGLTIHQADALTIDYHQFQSGSAAPLRIVGNLPYNISTPLLFHLLAYRALWTDLHVMLQQEVAERIVAQPGSKQYGRLSVMIQTYCHVELLMRVKSGAFIPAPQVHSAFLRLQSQMTNPCAIDNPTWHAQLVAAAFTQRRKTIRNSLRQHVTPSHYQQLGIDPDARPEQLSVATFAQLANISQH
jgi:16S rRNA (adenine1518-N6/adenine1519-N6)-dimethyltransferase